jgi:sn-glycerol 3-phosphate transport system permease protein
MAIRDDLTIARASRSERQTPARRSLLAWLGGYLALVLAVLLIGLPIYWTVVGSFKTSREIYSAEPTWLPQQPTLQNYVEAWNAAPFGRYYINSMITTALGAGAELFFAVTSAYALVFLRFPFKNLIFILLLAALMVPDEIVIVPNYLTVARLGWINTYAGIVVPGAGIAIGTFLLRQAFRALPYEVVEAARVDGAGHLRVLWSVVIPMALPAIVTTGMLSLVAKWNEFLWPLIVTNTTAMRTLPIGIFWLRASEGVIDWGVVMAGSLFVIIPLLLIFLYVQRYVVDGIAAGAVKG